MSVAPYPGLALPEHHPLAGRETWRCSECKGFFYPPAAPDECPYCNEPEDDE